MFKDVFLCQRAVKKVVTDTHTRRVGALFFGINSISAQLRTLFTGPFFSVGWACRISANTLTLLAKLRKVKVVLFRLLDQYLSFEANRSVVSHFKKRHFSSALDPPRAFQGVFLFFYGVNEAGF